MDHYQIKDINLGNPAKNTGHVTYRDAQLKSQAKNVVVKLNKFGNPIYSLLEVSFTRLAQLFLNPLLTPIQKLVLADKRICGVSSDHLCYTIAEKEGGAQRSFYALVKPGKAHAAPGVPKPVCNTVKKTVTQPLEIPIHFFDNLPQSYFKKLMKAEKKKQLTIDYDSLASILATSYTLEEDDLHKGNFGFYLVERDEKPHVVFFKIDHDLMFVDSIMAFHTRRPFHWFHGPNAFNIHIDDLINFPNLKHSANSYWPTKFGYLSHPFHNKEYHSYAENRAFAKLAGNRFFINAKWKSFYRHVLILSFLIENTLRDSNDSIDPMGRTHSAVIMNVMVARLEHLRAALFSIPEFRAFIFNQTTAQNQRLLDEITPPGSPYRQDVALLMNEYQEMCNPKSAQYDFEEGDTPLHTAIKMGIYRYEETLRNYGHYINTCNKNGKTPLDVALVRFNMGISDPKDVRKDTLGILNHLLAKNACKTDAFHKCSDAEKKTIIAYRVPNPKKDVPQKTYAQLQSVLREIGEEHQYSLKQKKQFAEQCIGTWLAQCTRKDLPQIHQLKRDLDGASGVHGVAYLKYICQLRSQLWIVRQFRGLYGCTSTQISINNLLDNKINILNAAQHNSGYASFFWPVKDMQSSNSELAGTKRILL